MVTTYLPRGTNSWAIELIAKSSLERALTLDPDFKPAQLAMVDVFIAEDQRLQAIELLERMTRKSKEGAEVRLKLGSTISGDGSV